MNKTEKNQLADQYKEKFKKANVVIFADYKGLVATDADLLRKNLREHKTEVKVLKNNIARLATKDGHLGNDAKAVLDNTVGPTLAMFAYGDPAAAAKVVFKFSQDFEALKLKESLMGQKKINVSEVEELAKLPAKEILLAKLLGTLNAPASNFVGVLAAVPRSLVTVLAAIQKKKENPSG